MTSKDKSKEFNPLATNILRLQKYNFNNLNIEDVIFFEYMVVKAQAFGFKPFFHSSKTISDETGIKKSKLATIVMKMESLGYITVEIKGYPKVKYFAVNFDIILKNLKDIYQFTENGKLLSEFGKLLTDFYKLLSENSQQKILNKELQNKIKEDKQEKKGYDGAMPFSFSLRETQAFLLKLEKSYNDRREHKKPGKYPKANLSFKKEVALEANEALCINGGDLINDAWMVYVDKMLDNEIRPRQILPYFFSKKEGSFDVIGSMADVHNRDYAFTNPKK